MKRYLNIWLIANVVLTLQAQQDEELTRSLNADENYVMTTTMLDDSANHTVKVIQFYDDLGRPSELVEGGISTGGRYLHSIQMFDNLGREYIRTLPAVGSTYNSSMGIPGVSYACQQTYNDTHYYSRTTYDALDRPVFTTTPGDNWESKGRSITYFTNGNNEVKRYEAGSTIAQQNGYYPAGSLTGERVTDEDGVAVTTFKDLTGRVVLERRGDGDDTYFVYDTKGWLCYVLQPMYQENAISSFRFRYKYTNKGRLLWSFLPGRGRTNHWYDSAHQVIAIREPQRGNKLCTRYFYYDGLGRLVVQGRSFSATPSNSSIPLITRRQQTSGTSEICHTGYYVRSQYVPSDIVVEQLNFYDDYAFLNSSFFTDSIPSGNFQATNNACATSLKTCDINITSDGHYIARVYYYDERGRVIDTRENLISGEFLQTTTTYSFTNKPLSIQKTFSQSIEVSPITETFTYDTQTDQLKYHDISYDNSQQRISDFTYDNLGRLSLEMTANGNYGIERGYNIHGWLTSINATSMNNYQKAFQQDLFYETGSGQTCYNGNISSMRWKTGIDGYGHGYKFFYDHRNRLTQANHTYFDMNDYPICYSERFSYNRDSAPVALKRWGTTGQVLDSLLFTYTGNLLKKIVDVSSHTVSNGMFEFVDGANSQKEYSYNDACDLKYDANKGIASIKYDDLGHPIRIQFTNGNLIEYVYAADGRKLRTKHTTAVDGLNVNLGGTLELTPAQTMACDSTEHADNIHFYRKPFHNSPYALHFDYHFDGGYFKFYPVVDLSSPGPAPHYFHSFIYYLRDHQGNNRLVVDGNGNEEQINEYYPYGGPWGTSSTNQGFQPYKYNGKELDRMHGLDWYDYGARRYDPAYCMFTQMDPLCEKYPHLSPYAYCAGNPVNYVDPDGRKPKPYEAALMAAYVYGDKNADKYYDRLEKLGWTVSSLGTSISNDSKNGFHGQVFQKTKNGVTEYAYAFAGTDINSVADIIADISQVAGLSSQYKMAIGNAKSLSTEIGDDELTFVGHSLGGGEAAAASMATGRAAITFNPAAVSNSTRLFHLLGSSRKVENYRSVWWKSGVIKLGFGGDPLNILQDRFNMKAPGRTYMVQIGIKNPIKSHSIESLIDKLWEME